MVASICLFNPPCCHSPRATNPLQKRMDKPQSMSQSIISRRNAIIFATASLLPNLISWSPVSAVKAEENDSKQEDEGVIDAIKSIFDPNEKTKTGKVLPKAYLKSAREVVKTLRESLKEDEKDVAKFRRTADAAKESIREYLNGWRGQPVVVTEESYVALEKAIRSLANFYSKAGPFATMPGEVRSAILEDLKTAEAFL